MITDCPNCSWIYETQEKKISVCPYCGITFHLFSSPYEQLLSFLKEVNQDSKKSPFFHPGYSVPGAYKNYTGWIVNRIRTNQRQDIIKLCCAFMSQLHASMMVNTILEFDFRKYIIAPDNVYSELQALWIVSGLCLVDDTETLSGLACDCLWPNEIAIRKEYFSLCLQQAKKERFKQPKDFRDEPIKEDDLILKIPIDNPFFDWGKDVPLAVRQRLILAIFSFCRRTEDCDHRTWIKLDDCTYYDSRMHGVDYGYTTKILMESNIFCDPEVSDFEYIFNKNEFLGFLDKLNIQPQKKDTKKQMLSVLLNAKGGEELLRLNCASCGYVQIHPDVLKYAEELQTYVCKLSFLFKSVMLLDGPCSCFKCVKH